MTELSTEPVAVEAADPAPPPPAPAPVESTPAATKVEHTPGGWPVAPLALAGANSTVGAVAAASLAGGPIAAMVAATGVVVLGTLAAGRSRTPNTRRDARRAAARTAGHTAASTTAPRRSSLGAGTGKAGGRSAASRTGRTGGGKQPGTSGQHRRGLKPAARHPSAPAGGLTKRNPSGQGLPKSAAGGAVKGPGRARQIQALRSGQQAAAGSRAERRASTTAARRAVADARRNAHQAPGSSRPGKREGLGRRLAGGAVRKARAARDAAINRQRERRDKQAAGTVAAQRARVRKAPARKAARQALRRSAARFHGRRLFAALLALPLGLLGCLTTPLGRKFGISWLMNPGRRLYRRLTGAAADQRAARDAAIRAELAEKEAAADAEATADGTEGLGEHVERPAADTPATPQVSEGELVSTSSGFKFEDHATEMQAAAMLYEPDGCMEILAMVEGLPEALNMVAHVMQILAERSDSEFPLEKEVANGFNDIYDLLRKAAEGAEELPGIFRRVHEQDIARHEDPRNGTEAEKGWNV
ncbi:hypothetical protein [Streptomyces sp. NPDC051452]|uniref:hypothetical protein n=1 Tax=Streptomyces sp. NPDC051452 TaxID=3365654 RepID=UPI00379CB6E0